MEQIQSIYLHRVENHIREAEVIRKVIVGRIPNQAAALARGRVQAPAAIAADLHRLARAPLPGA